MVPLGHLRLVSTTQASHYYYSNKENVPVRFTIEVVVQCVGEELPLPRPKPSD